MDVSLPNHRYSLGCFLVAKWHLIRTKSLQSSRLFVIRLPTWPVFIHGGRPSYSSMQRLFAQNRAAIQQARNNAVKGFSKREGSESDMLASSEPGFLFFPSPFSEDVSQNLSGGIPRNLSDEHDTAAKSLVPGYTRCNP